MKRALAEDLARKYKTFCLWFDDMTEFTIHMEDKKEAKRIRRALGETFILLDDAIRDPVSKKFPDLFPDDLPEDL